MKKISNSKITGEISMPPKFGMTPRIG